MNPRTPINTRVESILDLTVFIAIVKAGSLSKAARELNLSLALVSKRLSRLESLLNVRLVNRSTRSLSVTDSGQNFYERCLSILNELRSAEELIQTQKAEISGTIKITCSTSFARLFMAELITGFRSLHPKASVRLIDDDGIVNLVDAGIDLAIRQAVLPDSALIASSIASDYRIVCAAPDYLRAATRIGRPGDIAAQNCVVFGDPPITDWVLTKDNESFTVKVPWTMSTRSGDAAMATAISGGGLVYASIWSAQPAIKEGKVVNVLPGWRSPKRNIYAVHPSRHFRTQLLREFVNYLSLRAKILERDAASAISP